MNTISNESLKEYYVKLQQMYDNCFAMLSAIQQSLSTTASEITVTVTDTDDAETTIRVPSFLYLENRLEQIETNFGNLFSMPQSGEAWFTKSSDMYKLNMVRSSNAPIQPVINSNEKYAGFTQSSLLKDLVSPHMYLRAGIDNLPENAKEMYMKKIVVYDGATFTALRDSGAVTYDQWNAALFNYKRGEDYEEYDSVIKLPIRKDTYVSNFEITEVTEGPWVDETYGNHKHQSYKLQLSTLEYTDEEDSSIRFTLKVGDAVCLGNQMVVYVVKNVDTAANSVIIEEVVGHIALQTYEENSEMVLKLYNDNYAKYKYVDIPLEEDRFIVVFLGVIYNNVRSELSDGMPLDLTKISMRDEFGNAITDSKGNVMNYIDYYNKYCTNIGDLILGLTEAAFPQLSNYTPAQMKDLTESDQVQEVVTTSVDIDNAITVVPINKHLIDDTSSQQIINLHAQKNNIQAQLLTVNDNISQMYNTLTNTDFSQQTANSFMSLQSKLQSYYTERTTLQKQLNAIIDSISAKSLDVSISNAKTKYRIRGLLNTDVVENLVTTIGDEKVAIVGCDIEYKYKSTTKDTSTVTVIDSNTFTDWNRQISIPRQRHLEFEDNTRSWELLFNSYKSSDNIIKWNQVDIPITPGEDVIIRVRYKYNIGQPFVDLVTPWSDEFTVVFPPEYLEDNNVMSIVDTNQRDTVVAGFRDILINEGYEEHVTNKIVSSDQNFFHAPQNIYSGFTTPENNLISLYDKLVQMSQDIEQYKSWVEGESNSKFEVYLQYDDRTALLTPNTTNTINIYNTEHVFGTFIKKGMQIIIKNTGDTRVNLFSIFPGNTDISLIRSDIDSYLDTVVNYERVPIFINDKLSLQNMGQWIYFRQTNPYTRQDVYMNEVKQRTSDVNIAMKGEKDCEWLPKAPSEYMMQPRMQVLHVYRDRTGVQPTYSEIINEFASTMQQMSNAMSLTLAALPDTPQTRDAIEAAKNALTSVDSTLDKLVNRETIFSALYNDWTDEDFYYVNSVWSPKTTAEKYDGGKSNVYLTRYEDIIGTNQSTGATVFLDASTNISNFLNDFSPMGFAQDTDFSGAFVYPYLSSRQQIMTEGRANDKVYIDKGQSLSIPIVFEYYLDGNKTDNVDHTTVTKSLYFDIKNSLINNPIHYMIDITGHYDFTSVGDMYSNFQNVDLEDNVTNS